MVKIKIYKEILHKRARKNQFVMHSEIIILPFTESKLFQKIITIITIIITPLTMFSYFIFALRGARTLTHTGK